jgi:hypothetical protein
LLIDKFDYQEMNRKMIDGKRYYETPSGDLPSVTTILSHTKSESTKEGLAKWQSFVGDAKAEAIRTEAANVGTHMHDVLEKWILGEPEPKGNNMIHRIAKKMANTMKENIEPHITEVWGTEVTLYYPGLYAGATDVVGQWNNADAIMDFKQSNKPKKIEYIEDYYIQIVAYSLAHNAMFGTNIRTGHILICTRDLLFQHFEITENSFDFWAERWANRVDQYYTENK